VRLLLDEHLAPTLAEQLRSRGHDVIAVADDPALRGLPDVVLLDRATADDRAVVTYDVRGYLPLVSARISVDEPTPGLVVIAADRYPRAEIGPLLRDLSALMDENPGRAALSGRVVWLGS
jgi:predicted nuclease of predicted toxin-antitoxin system